MPLKIDLPITQIFKLMRADETGETYVTIRQARQKEHEIRSAMFAEASRVWTEGSDQIELKQKVSMEEVKALEVSLTLVDCNIIGPDDEPMFKTAMGDNGPRLAMTQSKFAQAWGRLPPEVASEIHEKVLELNPQWDPNGGKS